MILPPSPAPHGTALLRASDFSARYRLSRAWLHKQLKIDPTFPRPWRPSPRVSFFDIAALDDWFRQNRPQASKEAA